MTNEPNANGEARGHARSRIDRVNGWLLVGPAIAPDRYEALVEAGVTHVIDLRQSGEGEVDLVGLEARGIRWLNVPVENQAAPSVEQLVEAASWAEAAGDEAGVYVHCGGGYGRAAAMAVGLLIDRGSDAAGAEAEVRIARPEIRLNEAQMGWLRTIEASRNGQV